MPNQGCLWECDDGFTPFKSVSGIDYCLPINSRPPDKPKLALR